MDAILQNLAYAFIHIDEISFGIVMSKIEHIYNRVMALDSSQHFVSIQYL